MRTLTLLTAVALASAAFAGCMGNDDDGADGGDGMGQGTVTAVTADAPGAPSGGKSEVCWTVEGSGNVAHVAIHWDTESHEDEAAPSFQVYDAGAAYPDNAPTLAAEGYDLPGTFCADVDVPATGSLFVVGHAIGRGGGVGTISEEVEVRAAAPVDTKGKGAATSVEITRVGDVANGRATVCWRVEGAGNVPHVAIHWDDVSHATESGRTFQAYDLGASYPGNASAADPDGYDLPGSFCTDATVADTIYVVAHVIDVAGAPGRLSPEREVTPEEPAPEGNRTGTIRATAPFTFAPARLEVGPGANVTFENDDPALPHTVTAVQGSDATFDTGSVPAGGTAWFAAPERPGEYPFRCTIHPTTMTGTLVVSG